MSVITAIVRTDRWIEIEADGVPFLRLRRSVFRDLALREGDDLDPESFLRTDLPAAEYEPALKAAVAFLAPRARAVQEIVKRLERSGYHEEAIRRVIERLEALRFVGDERFAKEWAASRSGRALGKRRIQQELSHKGVDKEQIEDALSNLDPDILQAQALALAIKLCAKYEKADKLERRGKVTQALVRRGFDWEQASKAYSDAEDSSLF